ncbi:MAG: hypothetical protein HYS25_00690 [Ignavibacteriales bacterium]|nr:hypothetical protein [Ignavibacteriales bacterium]
MKKICILNGPRQSGKTTRLMQWAADKKNIDGIFQPVIEGKRFIYHISSKSLKLLEAHKQTSSDKIVSVGKFQFNKDVFEWAKNILDEALRNNFDWLIVDEVGPLELDGKGLEPVITKIINERESFPGKILFVVREDLLKNFLEHYNIEDDYELIRL